MTVPPLPTDNFTIVCLCVVLCIIYFVVSLLGYQLDELELKKCNVVYFQDDIGLCDVVYSISMTVKELICQDGTNDLIFRLRGSEKDGPLILYRDDGDRFRSGSMINLGVALPFTFGDLLEIDVACDNDCCDENEPIFSISDVHVRQLPRHNDARPVFSSWKRRASSAIFTTLASTMQTWVCMDTVTNTAGAGVIGLRKLNKGRDHVLRARDVAVSLPLTKEKPWLKKHAKLGYRPLHYLISLSSRWHDAWSDFSRLDHIMVMWLDQLAAIVAVTACFAYALEQYLGTESVKSLVQSFLPTSADLTSIDQFNLYDIVNPRNWFLTNALCLVHIFWIAFISSLAVLPLSIIWCRLFRLIGGKGFEKSFDNSLPDKLALNEPKLSFFAPSASARGRSSVWSRDERQRTSAVSRTSGTSLMLRTLECRSTHTSSCVTSSRRLRMEPMICNCEVDHITARSVAYVRTKMTKLRDEDIPSGPSGLKHPTVLHESHTQSTDAPQMPPPVTAPDGKGEIVRVARYCERLVQQAAQHIRDNSVIAECFEVAPDMPETRGSMRDASHSCCPRQCCRRNLKCSQQSFSNATFFTDEDAASVKEMISNFSLRKLPENAALQENAEPVTSVAPGLDGQAENLPTGDEAMRRLGDTLEDAPSPSGTTNRPAKSRRQKHHKNSGTESISDAIKSKTSGTTTSLHDDVEQDSPRKDISVRIGPRSKNRPIVEESSITWNKIRHHVRDAAKIPRSRLQKSSKDRKVPEAKAPFPSGISSSSFVNMNGDYDSVALTNVALEDRSSSGRHFPFKGIKIKLAAFIFLALTQVGEIFFVSCVQMEENKLFTSTSSDSKYPGGPGRMHAAALSCVFCGILYFCVTVHMVALLSFIIERLMNGVDMNEKDRSIYYDEVSYLAL